MTRSLYRFLLGGCVLLVGVVPAFAQTPTFLARTDYYSRTAFKGMVLADVNGDGFLDIVYSDGQPVVMLGNGDGTFGPPIPSDFSSDLGGMAVGDLNGDGKLDIVVGSATGSVQIGYGNGDGTFTPGPVITKLGAYSLTVADVNGDGLPDIVVSSLGVLVFLNQGGGVFGPYTTLLPGDTTWPRRLVT